MLKNLKYYYKKNKSISSIESSITTLSILESFKKLKDEIAKKKYIYFVRFGDGEFVTLSGKNHRNYKYSDGLAKELEESFQIKASNYLVSLPFGFPYDSFWSNGIYKPYKSQEKLMKVFNEKQFSRDKEYHNAFLFQVLTVFRPKLLRPFFKNYVYGKTKMFVGGSSKQDSEKLYGKIDYYIQTPFKHAYDTIDAWWPEVKKNMYNVDLIILSVGAVSNVAAKRLWNENVTCNVIDFGSMIDAVSNKNSRAWIRAKGHNIYKVLPKESYNISVMDKIKFFGKDILFFIKNQFN